jgi:hypothetical protein
MKQNKSESDLKQMISLLMPWNHHQQQQQERPHWFKNSKKTKANKSQPKTIKRPASSMSLSGRFYNMINHNDNSACHAEDDEILRHAKEKGREGSLLHISENGQDVLVLEMASSKLQVMAGTLEKLFIKLADESSQDFDYVDTYILSHLFFTDSFELLENLMARFHLEAMPGEASYFKKWQRCIQVKYSKKHHFTFT